MDLTGIRPVPTRPPRAAAWERRAKRRSRGAARPSTAAMLSSHRTPECTPRPAAPSGWTAQSSRSRRRVQPPRRHAHRARAPPTAPTPTTGRAASSVRRVRLGRGVRPQGERGEARRGDSCTLSSTRRRAGRVLEPSWRTRCLRNDRQDPPTRQTSCGVREVERGEVLAERGRRGRRQAVERGDARSRTAIRSSRREVDERAATSYSTSRGDAASEAGELTARRPDRRPRGARDERAARTGSRAERRGRRRQLRRRASAQATWRGAGARRWRRGRRR